MTSEKEYRNSVLNKIDEFLVMANEAVKKQKKDEHTYALLQVIGNLGLMVSTLGDLEDTASFIAVAQGLDDVLEKEFFSKVHGPREAKEEVNPFEEIFGASKTEFEKSPEQAGHDLLKKLMKESQVNQSTQSKQPGEFSIKAHILGVDDPDNLPLDVRKKLADALIQMGIPKEEIKRNLNLGGF